MGFPLKFENIGNKKNYIWNCQSKRGRFGRPSRAVQLSKREPLTGRELDGPLRKADEDGRKADAERSEDDTVNTSEGTIKRQEGKGAGDTGRLSFE